MYELTVGDCRNTLRSIPDNHFHCCITSPPYYQLRDYHHAAQIGRESAPAAYIGSLVELFREVRRVLRAVGTLWLNLGGFLKTARYFYDKYAVLEPNTSQKPTGRKAAALALKARGPGLWSENKEAHGGFVTWNPRGRNRRTVWNIPTASFRATRRRITRLPSPFLWVGIWFGPIAMSVTSCLIHSREAVRL